MALLSQQIRAAAITGDSGYLHAWFANRQGGRWADQLVRNAMPTPQDKQRNQALADLHARGVLTDDELQRLRDS